MKVGLSLQQLNDEVHRRVALKKDYIAHVGKLSMSVPAFEKNASGRMVRGDNKLILAKKDGPISLDINPIAHNQLIELTKINGDYYRDLQMSDPELLALNVNRRIQRDPNKRRTIRTLDGKCRAVLSDGYRALENEDLADAVLPILLELDLLVLSCQITDARMYIKAVDKRILKDVPTGAKLGEGHVRFDTVSPAITISNSEVGMGNVVVEDGVYTDWCTNLCSFGPSMRKRHTGVRAELSDDVYALLSDETKQLTDAAVWAQAVDLVRAAFDETKFAERVDKLKESAEQPIEGDVVEVVKSVGKRYSMTTEERQAVLNHLIRGADLTRYGLHAAITRTAEDLDSYDRATQFERWGGEVIELPKNDWKKIAEAA